MVTVYGMSDTVGPICLKQKEPYENRILGENIDDVIGAEVKRMIDIAYKRAQEIILAHMDKLQQVAERLLEKEIISAEEFESFSKNRITRKTEE